MATTTHDSLTLILIVEKDLEDMFVKWYHRLTEQELKLPFWNFCRLSGLVVSQNNPEKTFYQVHDSAEELGSIHDEVIAKYPEHVILFEAKQSWYPSLHEMLRSIIFLRLSR